MKSPVLHLLSCPLLLLLGSSFTLPCHLCFFSEAGSVNEALGLLLYIIVRVALCQDYFDQLNAFMSNTTHGNFLEGREILWVLCDEEKTKGIIFMQITDPGLFHSE